MKHFLRVKDFSDKTLEAILAESVKIKRSPDLYARKLQGKKIGLIFEKPSLRTRVSCEVGLYELGAFSLYISPSEVQLGKREAIKDAAQTFSRYLDGVIIRTFGHAGLEEFSRNSSVPVINGLSDRFHPLQVVGDLFTIQEIKGKLSGLKIAFVGDGNNVCNSFVYASTVFGFKLAIATPSGYQPDCKDILGISPCPATISCTRDPFVAAQQADVIYTDVWTSMGMENEAVQRKKIFKKYQVNRKLVSLAKKDCIVMHCLPAHRGEEITDEIMDSKQSVVFQQAENRLHTQKAVFIEIFGHR